MDRYGDVDPRLTVLLSVALVALIMLVGFAAGSTYASWTLPLCHWLP